MIQARPSGTVTLLYKTVVVAGCLAPPDSSMSSCPSLRISTSYYSSSDIAWAYYRVTLRTGVLAQRGWAGQLKYHFIRSKNVDAVFSFRKETSCLLLYYHKTNKSNTSYGWETKVIIILHMSAVSNDWNKVWRK